MEKVEIFPFIEVTEDEAEEIEEELPLAKEYAWDFDKEDFKYRNGKMYFVEGNEAIKVWIWKLLRTERYRDLIFSWDYGNEIHDLIGQGFTQGFTNSEAERYVREAIDYNLSDYVTNISNLEVGIKKSKNLLSISFVANTPYGEVEYNQ